MKELQHSVYQKSKKKLNSSKKCDVSVENLPNHNVDVGITQEENAETKCILMNINNIEDIINLTKRDDLEKLLKTSKKIKSLVNIVPALKLLNEMMGLQKVKQQIFMMCIRFLFDKSVRLEMCNFAILGPPGCGKTRLAYIIAKILHLSGRTKNDEMIVACKSDLIGKWLGHTCSKTKEKLLEARNSVLFIDEAYSLCSDKNDMFGKECIDTITNELSENPTENCLIIAGYKHDIHENFFNVNKGLERRFRFMIEIDRYTSEELFTILIQKIEEIGWTFTNKEFVESKIRKHHSFFKNSAADMEIIASNCVDHCMKKVLLNCEKKIINNDEFAVVLETFLSRFSDATNESVQHMYI
jgi:stage V sporulation protein K